jgi:hypothetical protein
MGLPHAGYVVRHNKITPPTVRSRSAFNATFTAIALAVVVLAVSFAVVVPTPAYADANSIEIVNRGRLRVDVMWASTSPFQGAFLWPDNTSGSQEFNLLDSGNGFYRIKARHSDQCLMLDWRGGSYVNGTPIIQYPYCSADYAPAEWSTQWVWVGCGENCFGGWYALIRNRATGRCLEAASSTGSPGPQAWVQQWDCIASVTQWNANNQMWTFDRATSVPGPIIH